MNRALQQDPDQQHHGLAIFTRKILSPKYFFPMYYGRLRLTTDQYGRYVRTTDQYGSLRTYYGSVRISTDDYGWLRLAAFLVFSAALLDLKCIFLDLIMHDWRTRRNSYFDTRLKSTCRRLSLLCTLASHTYLPHCRPTGAACPLCKINR